MKGAWEQELHDLCLSSAWASEGAAQKEETKMLTKETQQMLIDSFSPAQQKRIEKLMDNARLNGKSQAYREYQQWFQSQMDWYWPQPKKPKLKLVRGGKKQTI